MNYELEVVDTKEYESAKIYHLYLPHYHYMKQHFHHNVELVYLIQGSFMGYINGKAYHVCENELFLVNTNEIHYFEMLEDCQMITILISYDALKQYEPQIDNYYFDIHLSLDRQQELKEIIQTMDQYRKSQDHYKYLKLIEYLHRIYYLLLTDYKIKRTTPLLTNTHRIQNILEYIELHYGQSLSISLLAQEFHYSPNYLCRYFKKMCGMTVLQYIKTVQLNHAYIDVCSTDLSIATISHRHGFVDSKSFIKAFKQKYGKTPGTYRKDNKCL